MAGRKLDNLPPETPFLSSNGGTSMVDRTPILRRFQAAAGSANDSEGQQPNR